MKRLIIRTLAAAALLTTTAAVLATPTQDGKGRYAEVNGLKMYYEIHGTGRPLVLLHGAFGWATFIQLLRRIGRCIRVNPWLIYRPGSRIANVNPLQDQQRVDLGALSDLCTPWCVHVVATLRIAEHLAAGRSEINDLAAAAQCNAYCLQAVLRHLVGKGVFQEPAPGRFALNETARELLDPGQRLGLDLEGIGGRFARAWGTLLTYVRTGAPAYHETFGLPFWEDLDTHPDIAASFDALIGPA